MNYIHPEAFAELQRTAVARNGADTVSFAGWPRNEVKTFLQTIGKFVTSQTQPLQKQIEELKAQIEELKKRGVSYKGIYQKSCDYAVGDLVSFDHSVWCCVRVAQAGESPGAFPSQWQMALRGDGRDVPRQPTRGGARPEATIQRRTP